MAVTKQEFIDLVNSHDLTYSYSDDPSCYRRGREELNKILREAKSFDDEFVTETWNRMVDSRIVGPLRQNFYWKV